MSTTTENNTSEELTPTQKIEALRAQIKALLPKLEPGTAACVFITLGLTPRGTPEITVDSNCESREEVACVVHLARLTLPFVPGQPSNMEQAGAMLAGVDPRTGGRIVPGEGLIIPG